jgi:RNA polymerase sigma-70 factor, ECF subfamily
MARLRREPHLDRDNAYARRYKAEETGECPATVPSPKTSEDQSATPLDEREFLARLRAGDETAFRQVLAEFGPSMLRVAGAYAPDTQVAAEIVQDTWIAVLRGLVSFEGRSSLRTWLFTILGNCARRRAKLEARSTPLSSLDASGDDESELDCFFSANHSRWASSWTTINARWEALPEDALASQEAESAIMEKLRSLPATQSAVITLRDLDGFSSDEVCSLLGLSPGNQRVLLHRARLAVRRALQEVRD